MKLLSAKFTRRCGEETLSHLPKYEYEELQIEASFVDSDQKNIGEMIQGLKNQVYESLGLIAVKERVQEAVKKEEAPKEEPKKGKSKPKGAEETPKEVDAETPPEIPVESGKKKEKVTTTAYNRELVEHKQEYVNQANKNFKGWSSDKLLKVKVKDASIALEGIPFLDENGVVLESFVGKMKELIN